MPTGTVKWFNNAKGYGFILPDEGGEDLFVHYSSILMDGYKTLKAGQSVTFDVVQGSKGYHATNIITPNGPAQGLSESGSESRDQSTSREQEASPEETSKRSEMETSS